MAFGEFIQCNAVPNCNNRQLDVVLSARGGVSVSAASEGMQPVDAYHPPLAVRVAAAPSAPSAPPASIASPYTRPYHPSITHKLWNFNKADFKQLYNLLTQIDWSNLYN
ncbi:hypothetical protein HF086_011859 [Spodoptera exigua]|uniref:Uncharacterized protein n=1 Tax=Spodoptera exigua TaxID=7107 RepID=A0A922SNY7_SPOEX|nr:hypothetical protein HF086_011859 [Spodoptera exigua]